MLDFHLCPIPEIHLKHAVDNREPIKPQTEHLPRSRRPNLELGLTGTRAVERADIDDFSDAVAPDEEIIVPDDLDGAFLGISAEEDPPRAVYSIEKCIEILSKEMTVDEAEEYFWYNVAGAKGPNFPLFINTPEG